jgi:hypothetical protein
VRNNPISFYDPDGQDLQAGTSKDQGRIKKALVEIAKRESGRAFLNKLNDVNVMITLNAGEVAGKDAYGSTKGGEIVRSTSKGEVRRGDPILVTTDFKKADKDREENKAAEAFGRPDPHANVPQTDAQLEGHELAHTEAQLDRSPATEEAADARINGILAEPVDKNLSKDADKYVDNLVKPKEQEKKPPPLERKQE